MRWLRLYSNPLLKLRYLLREQPDSPKVIHSVQGLTRSVRCAERYQWQVWAYAYNPTHMAGLQVFFQAFENQNTLVNVFGLARNEVYSLIEKYSVTHISATPTFYRLLLPFEKRIFFCTADYFWGRKVTGIF